ncbi:uncharacterized protein LOC132731294 [Ruditapes philippinarum]|uniref:uncharacterized protein LOC132731294 n=1 Tax=Ruditapes philippinarum TaxID=129788 RepID=UPI00295A5C95|nr:uncharacterized protein LOC132731294 [Ruditapes philippinarum]
MPLTRQRSRVDGHFWYRTILITSVSTSGLALLLQFIGFVTPGWIVLSQPSGFTVSAGVWYIQVCNNSPQCRTASMTRVVNPFNVAGDTKIDFTNWVELQVEVTLAFVLCIAGVLLTVNGFIHMSHSPKSYLGWAALASVISAALLMIPIGRLLDILRQWDSYIVYSTPYSLVASCLGCVCALISALFSLSAMCMILYDRKKERLNSDERDDLTLNPT